MYKIIISFLSFFIIIIANRLTGQILPKEGSRLNYRLIGFSFPVQKGINKYSIEIAIGNFNSEDSFQQHIITSFTSEKNKVVGEVPSFGTAYTWRAITARDPHDEKRSQTKSQLYHFSTEIIPDADTGLMRLRIIRHAEKYKNAYVFLDDRKVLYNMEGQPVWFLPDMNGLFDNTSYIRDMKISDKGTITLFINNRIYEINYNGDILWRGPNDGKVSGDSTETYHHEFTRLSNGHYMVLGQENVLWEIPYSADSSLRDDMNIIRDSIHKTMRQKIIFGTVMEYDEKGKLVWQWKSSGYFKRSDLYNRRTANGRFDLDDTRENSFFFDERDNAVYVSFKTISRVIKIKYPEGRVINTYGRLYKAGTADMGNDFFCGQHSCRLSQDGYLYLYDNNDCNPNDFPKIVMMQEDASFKNYGLKKIWEYSCTIEDEDVKTGNESGNGVPEKKSPFVKGGNVIELPDRSFFVSMSGRYGKVFIVSRDRKILWSAMPEKWNETDRKWDPVALYRASMIADQEEMERLIFNDPDFH